LGRVLLTRKSLSGQNVDTYNVYDNYGQLVAVLPPGSVDVNGNVTQSLIFKYTYDNQNRLIEKKVPGADPQKFFYNSADQLILTQDGNMAQAAKYLATIYDDLGRVKKTGFSTSVSPIQGQDNTITEFQITELLTQTEYYPNSSWVKHQGAKVLKPVGVVNTNRNFVWSYIERRDANNYTGNPVWTAKQHLLAAGFADGPIGYTDETGVDWSINAYDGAQKPTTTVRYLYSGPSATRVSTVEDYIYDNGQRMTDLKYRYTLNGEGLTAPTFTLSNMN
jgi:YD repeat-containing protein